MDPSADGNLVPKTVDADPSLPRVALNNSVFHAETFGDPSHAAGNRDWVPPLARAALAAGADGLLVEAHPAPALAWSDGDQAIGPRALAELANEARLQQRQGLEAADAADAQRLLALVEGELERLLEARRRLAGMAAEATA